MAWIGALAGVAGGLLSSRSSKKAADSQADASRDATALQKSIYEDTVERNAPYVQGGGQGFNALLTRLGLSGPGGMGPARPGGAMNPQALPTVGDRMQFEGPTGGPAMAPQGEFTAPTAEQVMAEPGYQFGLNQGQMALDRKMNSIGKGRGGAALAAATRYGNDYASGQYGNAFSRMQGANAQDFGQRMSTYGANQAADQQNFGQRLNAFNTNLGADQQNFGQRLNVFNAGLGQDQQMYNQLAGIAGFGQSAANNTASSGAQFGSQAGNNLQDAADASAANSLAQANIWGDVINQGASAWKKSREDKGK